MQEKGIPIATAESQSDRLRRELAVLLETLETMQTKSGPLLTARYQATLGRLELQLLELQIDSQTLRHRIEALQSRLNLGQPVTADCLADIDRQIETTLVNWRQQLESQEQAWVAAREFLAGVTQVDADEARRVKTAYRQLARWLHPDASPQNRDLFDKYWPAVQAAYQQFDSALIEALQHLVGHALAERTERSPPPDDPDELARLRALINIHAERLARLHTEPPHCYADCLMDDAWIAVRQTELEAAIAAASAQLAQWFIRQSDLLGQLGIATGTPTGAAA
jgi:hypothetical protein